LARGGAITANQQSDLADTRDIFQEIDEPDFPDEAGHADQQDVAIRERFPHGKALDARDIPERRHRPARYNRGMRAGLQRRLQPLWSLGPAQLAEKFFFGDTAVERTPRNPRERAARSHDGLQQAAGGMTVAKFHTIGDKRLNTEVICQWTKNMVEELAYQDQPLAFARGFDEFLGCFGPQRRLQHVVEILFTQQVEAILTDPAQQRVQKTRREGAAGGIGKWPRQRHTRHPGPTGPTLRKTLRVPGEKSDRAQGAQFEQRSLHAPISRITRGFVCGRDTSRGNTLRIGQAITHDNPQLTQGMNQISKISLVA